MKAGLELDTPGKTKAGDEVTLRQLWMKRWEETGVMPQALRDEPEVPAAAEHVWNLYWALAGQRASNGLGSNPIDAGMIAEHCRLMRLEIQPWEAEAILLMEQRAYLPHQAERAKDPDKKLMIPAEPQNVAAAFRSMIGPKKRTKGGKKNV